MNQTALTRLGRIALVAVMAITFAAAIAFVAAPSAHAATTFCKKVMNGTDRFVTHKYDFTGDKQKDKFAVKNYHLNDSEYDVARVYINGKNVLSVKSQYYSDAYLFRIKSGRIFLYLKTYTDNDDALSEGIYTYRKGKMRKVLNTRIWPSVYDKDFSQYHKNCDLTHCGIDKIKVKKGTNIVKIKFTNMTSIAGSNSEIFYFKCGRKTGKMVRTSNTTTNVSTGYGVNNTLTAATKFKIFANADSTGAATVVAAGTKVTLKAFQLRAVDHFVAMQVTTSAGETGWITYKTLSGVKYENFHEGTLFTETMMAG